MELTNKRVQIDSLSSQMSSLARHHKNLLSKNNELSESIQRISQNIDQLKAVVWIKTIRVWKYICIYDVMLFINEKNGHDNRGCWNYFGIGNLGMFIGFSFILHEWRQWHKTIHEKWTQNLEWPKQKIISESET